jgi:FKBP-type peptidyl-prolyl cis-trans isomerase FkpA
MKFLKPVAGALLIVSAFTSCQNVDFKKTSAGVPYKLFQKGNKADSVSEGNFVKLQVVRKLKDSVLFSTYQTKKAIFIAVEKQKNPLTYNDVIGNIVEILKKGRKGDSIYLVQLTDSLLKDPQNNERLKKGGEVVTTIRIEEVYKTQKETDAAFYKEQRATQEEITKANQELQQVRERLQSDSAAQASLQKDSKTIEDYLKAHNIQARKTDWGIYIEEITPGSGPKAVYKQFTTVRYKGLDLNGKVFDPGTILSVQAGVLQQQLIPGFILGTSELQKGEKVRLYLPSLFAYGPQGSPPTIQPNQVLVFEMEVLDVSDAPSPQQQQQQPQQPGQ